MNTSKTIEKIKSLFEKDAAEKLPHNIPLLLRARAEAYPDYTLQIVKNEVGEYEHYSYKRVYNRVVETLRQKEVTKAQTEFGLPQVVVAAVVPKVLCAMDIVYDDVGGKDDVVEFFPRLVLPDNSSRVPAAYLHVILQCVDKHPNGAKRVVVGCVDVEKVFNRGGGRVHSCLVVE